MPALFTRTLLACLVLATLMACVTSPPVQRPAMVLPDHFKEQGTW